jgi:hypothetical protein
VVNRKEASIAGVQQKTSRSSFLILWTRYSLRRGALVILFLQVGGIDPRTGHALDYRHCLLLLLGEYLLGHWLAAGGHEEQLLPIACDCLGREDEIRSAGPKTEGGRINLTTIESCSVLAKAAGRPSIIPIAAASRSVGACREPRWMVNDESVQGMSSPVRAGPSGPPGAAAARAGTAGTDGIAGTVGIVGAAARDAPSVMHPAPPPERATAGGAGTASELAGKEAGATGGAGIACPCAPVISHSISSQ